MELNYPVIGARIRKIRKMQNMTQDKLSELSEISPQHLSQIEHGKTKLSLSTLVNICNALNVTSDRILCDVINTNTVEIDADIKNTFNDCSSDEIYLMLSLAENLKKSLRLKKLKLSHENT